MNAIDRNVFIEHRYIRDGAYSACRRGERFNGKSWHEDWAAWLDHIQAVVESAAEQGLNL